jgi:hypothetical protein
MIKSNISITPSTPIIITTKKKELHNTSTSIITDNNNNNSSINNLQLEINKSSNIADQFNQLTIQPRELKSCIGNCTYDNCCSQECCSVTEKDKNKDLAVLEEKQFKSLIMGDTVYSQLRSALYCGLKKPKKATNLVILPSSVKNIVLESNFIVEDDGIRFPISAQQTKLLYLSKHNTKGFSPSSVMLLQNIALNQIDLKNFPSNLQFLVTLRTDKPHFKVFANQESYLFNENSSTSDTKYGTVVYSGRVNMLNSNNALYSRKDFRQCLITRTLEWWNMSLPKLKTHPSKPELCVIKMEDEGNLGYANSVLAFWITKFFLPLKRKELKQEYPNNPERATSEYIKLINSYDGPDSIFKEEEEIVLNTEKKADEEKRKKEDGEETEDEEEEEEEEEQRRTEDDNSDIEDELIKEEDEEAGEDEDSIPERVNYLQFKKQDIIDAWDAFTHINSQLNLFVDLKDGMYLYFEPTNKKSYTESKYVLEKLQNNNKENKNYSISFSLTMCNTLKCNDI